MPTPLEVEAMQRKNNRQIAVLLLIVATLIVAMVAVGGATRLTDSGLSITEWKPVTGAIPPLNEQQWQEEFEKYKQIPEYKLVNKGMSMDEFKFIYYWEWGHRFFGRLIGLVLLFGVVYFFIKGKVEKSLAPKLVAIVVLYAAQGALGWYMVASGLVDRVDVSQYRLTAHLGLEFILFGCALWVAFDLITPRKETKYWIPGVVLAGAVYLQILLGGLVAGLDAGYIYNSWPLMEGALIPEGLFEQTPLMVNFFENLLTVQFDHRMLAYAIIFFFIWLAFRTRGENQSVTQAVWIVGVTLAVQVLLGIATLMLAVPISLGILHQVGAAALFGATLYLIHQKAV